MNTMHRYGTLVLLLTAPLTVCLGQQSGATGGSRATVEAVAAAETFLALLDASQRAEVSLPLNGQTRSNWSNLPTGTVFQNGATERNGVKLGDMTSAQQDAALALVGAALSPAGYEKVIDIVNADEALEHASPRGGGRRVRFGRAEYYVAILGTPSVTRPWMVQFGGHHLAINLTLAGPENTLSPSHTGAQPSAFSFEGRTVRPLGAENDKALALINALSPAQREQAVLAYRVRDVVLGPGHDGEVIEPEGVRASGFDAAQRGLLLDLIGEWVGLLNAGAAAAKMAEIEANAADTYFAWSGPTTGESAAYFRIQGPTVIIEYAPQGPDHIHTFYREPGNDYGASFIGP
jgi:Protein of unknown function (DUF3500)